MTVTQRPISGTSAKRLFLALGSTLAIVFASEMLVMVLLSRLPQRSMWLEALIDSTLLTILALPALYFFVLRPLAVHTARREQAERALAESESYLRQAEEKYQSIFEHTLHGIYQTTPDGTFVTANPAMAHILGYGSAQELIEDPTDIASRSYADPNGRAEFLRLLARNGAVQGLEYEVLCKDGRRRWVSENARAVRNAEGVLRYYEGTLTDITDRKRSMEAVTKSEARYSALTESAPIAIVTADSAGNIASWNQAAEITFGYMAAEIIGQPVTLLMPHRYRERHLSGLNRVWSGEEPRVIGASVELEGLRKDQSEFPLELSLALWETSEGRFSTATIRDITALKRGEEQMRELAELLGHARDAILVRDLEHRITYWNRGAERLYGWTAAEAVGRSVSDLLYKHPAVFLKAHDSVLDKGEWTGELLQIGKGGREVLVEGHWTLVRDRAGAPKSILMINTDITERKQLEQQFLRTQRLESVGMLAGGIAHDLNNVLAPIMMSIDLLKETATDDDSRSLLDTIGASAKRGADIVAQVLTFARGREGRRVEVQVPHLVREIEKIARETFPKNIQVRTTVSPDLWTVLGDPTQLHQVLLNLCINARDAMPEGGQITITADNVTFDQQYAALNIDATAGPHIVLQVEDTGTGIPAAIIDKIFDPFFTTKAVGKGTGLGLSTSLTIVKGHGGFLRVSSDPGAGTRFRICLPAQLEGHDHAAGGAAAELPRGDGETVLVVDDEAAIREITRQTLEASGYRVLLASDGAEAVTLYARHAADITVVIIDMMMPGMDGAAAIPVFVKMNPAVRIIAVSGAAASGQALPKPGAGVIQFLSKPYSSDTLLQALRQILEEGDRGIQS